MKNKKKLVLLPLLVFSLFVAGQGFSLSDTSIRFQTAEGKVMTQAEATNFVRTGPFNTKTETLPSGKKVVTLTRVAQEAVVEAAIRDYDWIFRLRGQVLPPFRLKDINGALVNSKDFTGMVTVINFWFTQCKPCVAEMPALNKLAAENSGKDVAFFGVTFDAAPLVQTFLTRYSFSFRLLAEAKIYLDALGVLTFPTTLVVDQKGVIREVFVGADHLLPAKIQIAIHALQGRPLKKAS